MSEYSLFSRLNALYVRLSEESSHMIGYPGTRIADFSPLYPFLNLFLNNIGDPYIDNIFRIHTHELECEVIEWFKAILRARDNNVWGYVTSGGTEGNMYGIYLAREACPGGIVYYSEDTHYSVTKILRMLNARSIMIRSRPDGEMDYDDLAETINVHRDVPAIIFANIGTTMRGAIDNLDTIKSVLRDRSVTRHYIHADAALSGMILPFVDDPQPFGFDAGIDSIAISGHKLPGLPLPCGVVLAKRAHVDRISSTVEYVGTRDTTVSGSRSGISPLFLWYLIKSVGEPGFRGIIGKCMGVADHAIAQLERRNIPAWRHRNSMTVVFPRPSDMVVKKWQIAVQEKEAHLIAMPHVTRDMIDSFVVELASSERQAA